jgi:hypothetical protein
VVALTFFGERCQRMNLNTVLGLIVVAATLPTTSSMAAMPEPDAWNIGSVFAAAQRCEMRDFIARGQATLLMAKLFSVLSPNEHQFIRTGYLEGSKREAVYSISQKQWFPVPVTANSCQQLQYTLDQYRLAANMRQSQRLSGTAREDFVKVTANGCMRAKIADEETKIIPNSLFEGYCSCYANALADKLTVDDIQSDNKAITDPITKAATSTCYEAMKAEALRLYKEGRYPKQ